MGLGSVKYEENAEKENRYDPEINIKIETNDIKDERGLELSYEQMESIKTEDPSHKRHRGDECIEHTCTKSCISQPDDGKCIKDTEIIKPEPNGEIDTFDDMENQNTVQLWEHNYCKYGTGDVIRHSKYKNNIQPDLSYKNMEIVKNEDINEEVIDIVDLSSVKVHCDVEYNMEHITNQCDVPLNEVKHEENVKEEYSTSYDTEMTIKTEINDIKDEEDTEEFKLSYEQVKSFKIEDAVYKRNCSNKCMEHASTESYISLDKLESDNRRCIKGMEIIKPEPNEEIDTSDGIEVDLKKQNTVLQWEHDYCKYETEDVTRYVTYKKHFQQHKSPLQHRKLNAREPDLSYQNMEVVEIEGIKEELIDIVDVSSVKVSSDTEHLEQLTLRSDILLSEVDLASMKYEETVEEEKNAHDIEIDHIKSELDTEELVSSYEQLKSINVENTVYKRDCSNKCKEHTSTKCSVSFNRLEPERQYINSIENIKLEQNEDTSNPIDVSIYENIQQHTPLHPADKAADKAILQTHFQETHKRNVKYFKCHFCEYITDRMDSLKLHFERRHNENGELYQYSNCKYKSKGLVECRRLNYNEPPEWFRCNMCDFKTKYKHRLLRHHRTTHNAAEVFHCEQCDFKTKYKGNLLQHHTLKHDDAAEIFCCGMCNLRTRYKSVLMKHYRSKHVPAEVLNCEMCDFKTKYKSNLSQHHRLKHDDAAQIFHCELCDFKTKYKHSLPKHRRIKHDGAVEMFHCKLCGYKTKYKSDFLRHKLEPDDAVKIFQCKLCDFKIKNKHNFFVHLKLKHDDAAEILHCKLCHFKTKHKSNLLRHHRSNHDDTVEIFKCELCDFKTKHKSNLLRHHRSNHDDAVEIFQYELCDFKTQYKYVFLNHRSIVHDDTAEKNPL